MAGPKYPATQWPAIIDTDTHERLVKLFADPARRKHVVRAPAHLLSGIATCPKCGRGLHYRRHASDRADSYGCVKGPAGCGGTAIKADLLEEYVTGAVLDALESPRVQQALREGEDQHAPRRADLLAQIGTPRNGGRGPPRLFRPGHRPGRLAGYPAAHRGRDQRRAAGI